jgi:hypothetical protein
MYVFRLGALPHVEHGWVHKENFQKRKDEWFGMCDGDNLVAQHAFDDTLAFFRAYREYPARFAFMVSLHLLMPSLLTFFLYIEW